MTVVASGELELKLSQQSLTRIEATLNQSFSKVRSVDAKLDPKAAKNIEGMLNDAARKGGVSGGNAFSKAFGGELGKLSGALGTSLLAGLGAATFATIGFDKAMSGVQAVAGATAGELGTLRAAALEAGKATVFSASQAAQAEAELAKAGVSVADILGGGLRGALDLAAAGQIDLAEAATITAQALNIFSLAGSESAHVADVLAAAANKSAADVPQLGQALRQGGLGAKQAGLSLEETAGALALFADNALIGSDAGTSLKTFLMRLVPSSNEARKAMAELGIEFFDANGNMKSLASISDELKTKMAGLTQQQRSLAFTTIFGADATRAATILYEAGAEGVREYTAAVDDQGAAGRNAAIQLDNLAGDLEQLKGSIETALIGSGSGGTAALRGLAQAANDAVGSFINLPAPVQFGATAIAGVAGAGLAAVSAFAFLQPKLALAKVQLEALGPAGTKAAAGLGAAGKVAGALGIALAGLAAVDAAAGAIDRGLHGTAESFDEVSAGLVGFTVDGKAAGDVAGKFGAEFENLGDIVKKAGKGFDDSIGGKLSKILSPASAGTGKNLAESISGVKAAKKDLESLDKALAHLATTDAKTADAAFNKLAKAAEAQGVSVKELKAQFPAYTDALRANETQLKLNAQEERRLKQAAEELAAAEVKANDAAQNAYRKTAAELERTASGIKVNLKGVTSGLAEAILGGLTTGFDENALKEFLKPFEKLGEAIGKTLDVGDMWQKLEDDGVASIRNLNKALESQFKSLMTWRTNLQEIAKRGGEAFAAELLKMGPQAAGLVEKIAAATGPEFDKLKDNFATAGELSGVAFSAQLSTELEIAAALGLAGGQKTAVQIAAGVAGGIDKVTPELVALVESLAAKFKITIPVTVEFTADTSALVGAAAGAAAERALGVDLNANGIIGRAGGGPFPANQTMWVGEEGPELVRFGRAGTVINNTDSRKMAGNQTTNNITINEAHADPRATAFTVASVLGEMAER